MSITSGNVRNLNESRVQALQALQSVSERLGDILVDNDLGDGTRRDETGDLVNEEGLPIIDITEPVDDLDTPSLSAATDDYEVIEEDNYPEPLSKFTPEALAVSRKHRDKILDLLEQEEEREERKSRQERQLELKRKKDASRIEIEKRMQTQGFDLKKRRQASELEKKMAKALISGSDEPEIVKPKAPAAQPEGKTKKVVTFADLPATGSEALPNHKTQNEATHGDVVPATLPVWKSRVATSQTQPMKMEVVERTKSLQTSHSVSTLQPSEKPEGTEPAKDSDDDSDLFSSTVLESEDDDVVLSAQRHRELALEYHRRREALVSNAATLKYEDDELPNDDTTNWDKEEVPLDATLAHPHPKPRFSKFKASLIDRMHSQTPVPVTEAIQLPSSPQDSTGPSRQASFGTSVLPAASLSKSIKLGKLVDGQLVAGPQEDGDAEEREEEEIRKLLLKSMEEYSGIASQVMGPAAKGSYWANTAVDENALSSRTPPIPSTSRSKPKGSRFKVSRTQTRTPSGPEVPASPHHYEASPSALISSKDDVVPALRSSGWPVSGEEERSSPKFTSMDQNSRDIATPPITPSLNVISSPSFASPSGHLLPSSTPSVRQPLISPISHNVVIDSPSFILPSSPNIIDSPSFRRPRDLGSSSSAHGPLTIIPTPSNHPSGQPPVMVNNVREKSVDRGFPASTPSDVNPRKVSRFKADRSGD